MKLLPIIKKHTLKILRLMLYFTSIAAHISKRYAGNYPNSYY